MKKRVTYYLIVFLLIGLTSYNAQITYTWTGAGTGNDASDPTNWGTITSTAIPANGDNVVFDGTSSKNCNWDLTGISSFSVLSGYGGLVDISPSGGVIVNGDMVINSGTVSTGSADITFNTVSSGSFVLSGSGNFDNTGGSVTMGTQQGSTFNFSGNVVVETLNVTGGAGNLARTINFGTNLIVTDLFMSSTGKIHAFQGTVHIKNSLSLSGSSYTSIPAGNTGTFIFDGTSASIVGTTTASRVPMPNFEMNCSGTFAMSGHIDVQGNWTGTQGTLTAGTSTVDMFGSTASILGAAASFDNLVIQSGATVSFPAGQEVKIAGNITRTGTLNIPSTSILGLIGTGAQSLSGASYALAGLRGYTPPSGSRVITLSTAVDITDFVEVQGNVTLASGSGNLRLKASSSGAGRVSSLQSGGIITGSVVVETYLPGPSTGWANLGVRGVMGQTVKSWDTYSTSSQANGIPMTCNGCSYDENALGSHFVSIQDYTESSGLYGELTGSSALNPGQGYWTYVGSGTSATSDLMVINTGSLVQGQKNVPVTKLGTPDGSTGSYYNLVANPYASPVLWSNVFNNNPTGFLDFEESIYVWNADLVGGTGDFATYNVNTTISSGGLTDEIAGGQGFYVGVTSIGAPSVLEFHEIDKVTTSGNAPVLKPAAANTNSMFRLKLTGPYSEEAETVINFHPNATSFYDKKYDAHKMFMTPGYVGYQGPYTKYTTISTKDGFNVDYAINSIPPLTQSVSIPVLARVAYAGTFNISVFDIQNFNPDVCIGLVDKLNNTYHDLRNGAYSFAINDTTSAPRFDLILCKDNSVSTVGVTETNISETNILINQNQDGAYVRTAFPVNTKATISAYNLMGQKLMEDINIEGTTTNTRLNLNNHGQVVFITVNTAQGSTHKKMLLN